jgi:hypothetical protein
MTAKRRRMVEVAAGPSEEGARRQCIAHHDNAGPTLSGFTSAMIGAIPKPNEFPTCM